MRVLAGAFTTLVIIVSTGEARGDEVADFVGTTASGLPGIGRVAVAAPRPAFAVTVAGTGGYGFTEAQKGEDGSHHRGAGTLGIALHPLRFLAASFQLEGRVDTHPRDVVGDNTSALGEPRLAVRAAESVGKAVALGAQIDWRLPGAEVPSLQPVASSFDGRLLATFVPAPQLAVAVNAGYRLDRTAELVANPARLRRGDRISLGASAFDAIPVGVGVSRRFGRFELTGEVTWDLLVGNRAPSAIESPLHTNIGGRYSVTDSLQAELRADVLLSQRPGSSPQDPIAPIDPRFGLTFGFRFTKGKGKPVITPPVDDMVKPPKADGPPPNAVATGSIRGKVTGDKGEPIAGATVSVGDRSVQTGPDGTYVLTEVPPGKATVTVKAKDFEDRTFESDVVAGAPTAADIAVKHAIKPGQLRGLIRAFSGKPLSATIRVEPLGTETKTDEDGVFQIDVPPGTYEVVVTATGYATQKRKMQVDENGVTILNADLRQGGP